MAVTGGKTSVESGGVNFIIADGLNMSPEYFAAICVEILVMSGFLFAIFLLAYRMFRKISETGNPFTDKYVRTLRAIGILVVALAVVAGTVNVFAEAITGAKTLATYTELPGIFVGAIIFCLSYIVDYGCALQKQSETKNDEKI